MPRVSVIVPTYNRAYVIREALDSLLAQTYQDFEAIVVDDGSTDDTAEVVSRYGPPIRYLRRESNGGAGAARNDGIRASEGEFVTFVDADDLYLPRRLEASLAALEASPDCGGAYAEMHEVAPDGKPLTLRLAAAGFHASGWVFRGQLLHFALHTNTVTVRRRCFDEVGLFDEALRAYEDQHMWLRLTHRYRFACVPEPLAVYRHRALTPAVVAGTREYAWQALLKALEDMPDLTRDEQRLLRTRAIAAMVTAASAQVQAAHRQRAQQLMLMAAAKACELPLTDRLWLRLWMAARHPFLAPFAAAVRRVRDRSCGLLDAGQVRRSESKAASERAR
jgi:cellulose synthase/poly-beta-1,6-N-acetylglucosamine synthase-like glycosyltransferase